MTLNTSLPQERISRNYNEHYDKRRDASALHIAPALKNRVASTLGTYAEYPSVRQDPRLRRTLRRAITAAESALNMSIRALKRRRQQLGRTAAKLLPHEKRIAECNVRIAPMMNPGIEFHEERHAARFAGLVQCDSYSCPHCAPRRAEQDRHELVIALAQAQ